jgi:hypothetical protein
MAAWSRSARQSGRPPSLRRRTSVAGSDSRPWRLPSLSLPPLEFCLGASPIQADSHRPDLKACGSATGATNALANSGPMPGISINLRPSSLYSCVEFFPHISAAKSRNNALATRFTGSSDGSKPDGSGCGNRSSAATS